MNADLGDEGKLETLRHDHADLSEQVERLQSDPHVDQWLITDLKKKKLRLKEQIKEIGGLNPDGTVNHKPRKVLMHHI